MAFLIVSIFLSQPFGLSAVGDDDESSWDTTLSESEVSERSFIVHTPDEAEDEDDVTELREDNPDELLMREIENGLLDQRYLQGLISEGADIGKDDEALLRRAIELGNVHSVRLLLQHGANIHALEGSVLRSAVSSTRREVVEEILEWSKSVNVGTFAPSLVYELYEQLRNFNHNQDCFEQIEIAIMLEDYLDFLSENLSYRDNHLIHVIKNQEIREVTRLLKQQANVHSGDGLTLVIAVIKRDVVLVKLLLEYAHPTKQGLFPFATMKYCIKLVKNHQEDGIFYLLQRYFQEFWDNSVVIANYEMHRSMLDNDPLLLRRWLSLGADIHYAQDEILIAAAHCSYHELVEILLSWSLRQDQLIYSLALIHTLIEEAGNDLLLVSMLEKYKNNCQVYVQPEQ